MSTDQAGLIDAGHDLDAIVNSCIGFIYTISREYKIEFMNRTPAGSYRV